MLKISHFLHGEYIKVYINNAIAYRKNILGKNRKNPCDIKGFSCCPKYVLILYFGTMNIGAVATLIDCAQNYLPPPQVT